MEQIKLLSYEEEKKLTKNELIKYYAELREYLVSQPYSNFSKLGIATREKINVMIKKILNVIIKYDIKIDGLDNIPDSTVIYASSHQDFNDIINSIYACPEHILTLNASNISMILKMLLNINGVFFVNRDDKNSRFNSKLEMSKAVLKGRSVNLYPEATWNCSPNKLHLPLYIGMVDVARITGAPIIPVVQEYTYDQSKLDGKSHVDSVHIMFGKPVYVSIFDDRFEKLEAFDEIFSTLKWRLLEEKGVYDRNSITNQLYIDYIKARINDWKIPKNDIYEERKQVLHADSDFYLFHYVNDVDFNEKGDLLPTEYVRRLNEIYTKRLKKN